jgi:hypothetical protein
VTSVFNKNPEACENVEADERKGCYGCQEAGGGAVIRRKLLA